MECACSMDIFIKSIKKKYQERFVTQEEQWPPCQSTRLIRLELVEREKIGYSTNIQRGIDDDKFVRTPLDYGDIFKAESGKRQIRKVLVEGDAGVGKTTLCTSISVDWADGKLFQHFDLVLLLPLRLKAVASVDSLCEIIRLLHSSKRVCDIVTSFIEEKEGERVLIIADGWDELSDSNQRSDSSLHELLFQKFPLMSVLVTSRPSALAPLRRLPQIDRFVEVHGFSKGCIVKYIQSEFGKDQEKACRLLKQLENNPLIESVCGIPVNCAIVCHLWRTLEGVLPTTMTELYRKIILNAIFRNIRKISPCCNIITLLDFDSLPGSLQESWWLLCKFSFFTLKQNQLVFSQKELTEIFPQGLYFNKEHFLCFGLLQSSQSVLAIGYGISFHFIRLTFQEYLAALHLSKLTPDEQLKAFLSFNQKQSHSSMIWKFFFGIHFHDLMYETHLNVKNLITSLADMTHGTLSILHCAFEAQNEVVTSKVIEYFNDHRCDSFVGYQIPTGEDGYMLQTRMVYLGGPCTAHDCAALLYVLARIQVYTCNFIEISLGNSGVTEAQLRILADILASKRGRLQVVTLNLSNNKLTNKCVSDVFCRASAAFQALNSIYLDSNMIEAEGIISIANVLGKSSCAYRRVTTLDLSYNPLGVSGLEALENAVCSDLLARVYNLNLQGSLTSDADINASWLNTFIAIHCPHLTGLDISQNNLGVPGASTISRVVSRLQLHLLPAGKDKPNIQRVFGKRYSFNKSNLGNDGLSAFIMYLEGVHHFIELDLNDNNIDTIGISFLADALCSGKILIESNGHLNLSDNPLYLEGTIAIGRILSSSLHKLESVGLSRCKLTTTRGNTDSLDKNGLDNSKLLTDVGRQLYHMPALCTGLSWLGLNDNNFTGDGIYILAGLMHLCTCLKHLSTEDCKITSNDLKNLVAELTHLKTTSSPDICTKLEIWSLMENQIDDDGVAILVYHLPLVFPSLGRCNLAHFYGPLMFLQNNPVSNEMMTRFGNEFRKQHHQHFPTALRTHLPTTSKTTEQTEEQDCQKALAYDREKINDHKRDSTIAESQSSAVDQSSLNILDQMIDFDNCGVSKHLGKIADSMCDWEGPIAEHLGLTPADIAAIKTKYPGELRLQVRTALKKGKQRLGSDATYSNLISVFRDAGYCEYANVVYQVLQMESPQSTAEVSNTTVASRQPLLKTKCTIC